MSAKQIELARIGRVTLYKRRGNRSLRLSITPAGEVRVSLPYWLSYRAAAQFAESRLEWIVANRPAQHGGLQDGQAVGKAHRLYFDQKPGAAVSTRIRSTEIRVTFPPHISPDHETVQQAAHKAALRALRKEAEQLLPQRLDTLAAQHGFTYKNVRIKHLKSRWGSCNSSQEIALNLFLMQLPWHLIDYVLLHELTHTRVMRHGPPFWAELERHLPHVKQLRKEIHAHHPALIHAVA